MSRYHASDTNLDSSIFHETGFSSAARNDPALHPAGQNGPSASCALGNGQGPAGPQNGIPNVVISTRAMAAGSSFHNPTTPSNAGSTARLAIIRSSCLAIIRGVPVSVQHERQKQLQQRTTSVPRKILGAIMIFAGVLGIALGLGFGLRSGDRAHSSGDEATRKPQVPGSEKGREFYATFLYTVRWYAAMASTQSSTFKTRAFSLEYMINQIYRHSYRYSSIRFDRSTVTRLRKYNDNTIQVIFTLKTTSPLSSYSSFPYVSEMKAAFRSGYVVLLNSAQATQSLKDQAKDIVMSTFDVYSFSTPSTTSTPITSTAAPTAALPDVPCGDIRVLPDMRIVGGSEALKGGYPWMVMLIKNTQTENGEFFCGGSILDRWNIITAAHCLEDEPKNRVTNIVNTQTNKITVIAGKYESNTTVRYPYEQRIPSKAGYMHHRYRMTSIIVNDIAVIRLSHPLQFNSRVAPLCLPHSSDPLPPVCVTAGWGTKDHQILDMPETLHTVTLRTYNYSECRRTFQSFRHNNHNIDYYITNEIMCAANTTFGGQDACQGDSGGPLFCLQEGAGGERHYTQFGVVSWGIGCADPGKPGFYTSLSHFVTWVRSHALPYLEQNSGGTTSQTTDTFCGSFSPLTDYRLIGCRSKLQAIRMDSQCSDIEKAVQCVVDTLSRYQHHCSEQQVFNTILTSSEMGLTSQQLQQCLEVLPIVLPSSEGNSTCYNQTAVSSALTACTKNMRCVSMLEVTVCVHSFVDPTWQQCSRQSLQDYIETHFNDSVLICEDHAVLTLADGRQFMYMDGTWHVLCGDHWGQNEVKVACTHRGFKAGRPSFIHRTKENVYVSDLSPSSDVHHSVKASDWIKVTCSGNEKSLAECALKRQTTCSSSYLAASVCYNTAYNFSLLPAQPGENYGYMRLSRDEGEGTVCVPKLSDTAAHLLCRQAGYVGGMVYPQAMPPPSSPALWETEMRCGPGAVDVNGCAHGNWTLSTKGSGSCALAKVFCFATHARLHNGLFNNTGVVQVYRPAPNGYDVTLKTVCRQGFNYVAAGVLCCQLGFSGGGRSLGFNPFYKPNTDHVSVQCLGTESRLENCTSRNVSRQLCTEPAVVKCSPLSISSEPDLSVRLSTPSSQVQVSMGGQWGTLCTDHWTDNEAAAICRQLGHLHGYRRFPTWEANVKRSLPHVLHSVRCGVNASSLQQCSYQPVTSDICQHSPPAAVLCSDQFEPVYSLHNSTIQLSNRGQAVHVNYNDREAPLRSIESERTASAVCQALGYVAGSTPASRWTETNSRGDFWWLDSQSNCTEQSDLQLCLQQALQWITCTGRTGQDQRCYNSVVSVDCYASAARVHTGFANSTGIVQLYRNGQWWEMCHDDMTQPAADVICRDVMGSTTAAAIILSSEIYWRGRKPTVQASVYCDARDSRMKSSDCIVLDLNSKCESFDNAPASVVCYDGMKPADTITSWKIDRPTMGGLVWVKRYGVWGTICFDKWTRTHADLVCRHLGYIFGDYENELPVHDPTTPMWAWSISCPRSRNTDLEDCEVSLTNDVAGACNGKRDAMAVCTNF